MIERGQLTHQEKEARDELRAASKAELYPALAELVLKGIEAYDLLMPLAKHVSTVRREYPLRFQEVHNWGMTSIISEYLMIGFGNHHDLLIYKDFDPGQVPWKLTRTKSVEDGTLDVEHTEVKQTLEKYSPITGSYELEVSTYWHPQRIGLNRMHKAFLSTWPGYENAEQHIQTFSDDLDSALNSHL